MKTVTALFCLGLFASIVPMAAHHSGAMYDSAKTITLKGTITELRWTNPHVVLSVSVEPRPGEEPAVWVIELSSPGNLTRFGWTRQSLTLNDRVEMEIAPLRDGNHGGAFRRAKLLATRQVLEGSAKEAIHAGEKPNLK